MTLSDWTFTYTRHTIDSSVKKQGLSSLKITGGGPSYGRWNKTGTTDIAQAMIKCWAYWTTSAGYDTNTPWAIDFRRTQDSSNGYRLYIKPTSDTEVSVYLQRYSGGGWSTVATATGILMNKLTWYDILISYWLSGTDLVIKCAYSSDGISYTKFFTNYTDTNAISGTYIWVYSNTALSNLYYWDNIRLNKKLGT